MGGPSEVSWKIVTENVPTVLLARPRMRSLVIGLFLESDFINGFPGEIKSDFAHVGKPIFTLFEMTLFTLPDFMVSVSLLKPNVLSHKFEKF